MSNYNILFSLAKNSYLEGAPVVVETGALVTNTETGRLHIQLKCKNLESSPIVMLKAEFLLMDSIGREVERSEYQYVDLNAKLNESFCDRVPVYVNNDSVRKFSARIVEVCFNDGTIWTSPENVVWEQIPSGNSLSSKLLSKEARDEFARVYCQKAKVIPFAYKDLWICSCQNANKNSQEQCSACRAVFAKMTDVDNETLKEEGKLQIKVKQKKIIGAISCAVIAVLISISIGLSILSISKASKYKKAQEYIAQGNYSEALPLLERLGYYKDAVYLYAWYSGNCAEIVQMNNLTEFIIPDGVTSIGEYAFRDCGSLTSIVIPDSVTSIGQSAFAGCGSLTSIVIPDGVTSIGAFAFYGCHRLWIYCEAKSQPKGWSYSWNNSDRPVVWGYRK